MDLSVIHRTNYVFKKRECWLISYQCTVCSLFSNMDTDIDLINPLMALVCMHIVCVFIGSYFCFPLNSTDFIVHIVDSACFKGPTATKWLLSNPTSSSLISSLLFMGGGPSVAQSMDYLIRERLEHPPGSFITRPAFCRYYPLETLIRSVSCHSWYL